MLSVFPSRCNVKITLELVPISDGFDRTHHKLAIVFRDPAAVFLLAFEPSGLVFPDQPFNRTTQVIFTYFLTTNCERCI